MAEDGICIEILKVGYRSLVFLLIVWLDYQSWY